MIIVECPTCSSRYKYDEARFEGKASKKIKCAKCATVFEIHHPAVEKQHAKAAPSARPAPPAAKAATRHDNTGTRPRKTLSDQTRAAKPKAFEPESPAEPSAESNTDRISTVPRLPVGIRLSIAIIDGDNAGTVFRVTKPQITIGREGGGADVEIKDTEASRQHAMLEIRETLVLLNDLESKNGTQVDGEAIQRPVELHDKSEFQVGNTTFMLIVTQES